MGRTLALLAGLCAAGVPAISQAQATPAPYSVDGTFSLYSAHTSGVNATGALDTPAGIDDDARTDLSNGLVTFAKNAGRLRFGLTAGVYAFPTVGEALNPTVQANANTALYGYVPQYYVAFVPDEHVTVSAGQLATLLGQEDGFTYQNINVQRGLVWAAEPVFSRGVRFQYTQGKFTGDLEYDDGYYSGSHRAFEGLLGWAPSQSIDLQFAFIRPQADTPGNMTSAIANKTEYDVMLTQQIGKLQLLPYALFIDSPANAAIGYASNEAATGAAFLADYAVNDRFSVGARYEWFADHSGAGDTSANADFLGYGPGSRAASFTITPAYKAGLYFVRAELSTVDAIDATPGLAFDASGDGRVQTRVLVETGVEF